DRGVASARATRVEGDRPPEGPLEERVCTSARLTAKIQEVRTRGRPGIPLGSAPVSRCFTLVRARGERPLVLQRRKEAYGRSVSGDHSRVARPVKRAAVGASA